MQNLDEFRIYYNHTIHPELVRMDRQRLRLLRLILFSIFFLFGVILFEIYLDIFLVTLLLMIPVFFYISYLLYQVRKFRLTFKPRIMGLLLDFIDDAPGYGKLNYDAKRKIPIERFLKSRIFGTNPAVYEGEDYIEGRFGEIQFEMCELDVREFSKVRNRLNYVFRGVFMHARINASLSDNIVILPRDFRQYLTRSIKMITEKGGKNIDNFIANKRFRKEFMTYGKVYTNVKESLSESMQQAVLDYVERSDKYIYLSFIGKDIHLAVTESRDILEPHLFQSNVSFDLIREFFEDIHLLLGILEDFDAHH